MYCVDKKICREDQDNGFLALHGTVDGECVH